MRCFDDFVLVFVDDFVKSCVEFSFVGFDSVMDFVVFDGSSFDEFIGEFTDFVVNEECNQED